MLFSNPVVPDISKISWPPSSPIFSYVSSAYIINQIILIQWFWISQSCFQLVPRYSMSLAAFSRCFAWSDDPDMMFCHRGQSSSDKNHCYEQGREEAAVSHSVSDQTTDLFHSKEGRQMLSPSAAAQDWLSVPRVGEGAGRSGPLEWGDTGLGQDWALNTSLILKL